MIAIDKKKSDVVPAWHKDFLMLLPAIRRHALIAFRNLNPEARQEAVQEVVSNALVAYRRLVELNKTDIAYASALARYGVAQVKAGQQACCQQPDAVHDETRAPVDRMFLCQAVVRVQAAAEREDVAELQML